MWYWLSLSVKLFLSARTWQKQHWLDDSFCRNYRLFSYGCACNDNICKHSQWINLHMQRGPGHLLGAADRGPCEKPNHWVHYTDTVMTLVLRRKEDRKDRGCRWHWFQTPSAAEKQALCPSLMWVAVFVMSSGGVRTSTERLSACGRLKQNQLQKCHTASASLGFSRDMLTFLDKWTIKIDNNPSSC